MAVNDTFMDWDDNITTVDRGNVTLFLPNSTTRTVPIISYFTNRNTTISTTLPRIISNTIEPDRALRNESILRNMTLDEAVELFKNNPEVSIMTILFVAAFLVMCLTFFAHSACYV
ncbi:hypothetical protein Q1695_009200 [Nippostrongylus brasiliensis]|nr:hypothetical protein Q1695_009200 [Nippostrongylus brasiliensis]